MFTTAFKIYNKKDHSWKPEPHALVLLLWCLLWCLLSERTDIGRKGTWGLAIPDVGPTLGYVTVMLVLYWCHVSSRCHLREGKASIFLDTYFYEQTLIHNIINLFTAGKGIAHYLLFSSYHSVDSSPNASHQKKPLPPDSHQLSLSKVSLHPVSITHTMESGKCWYYTTFHLSTIGSPHAVHSGDLIRSELGVTDTTKFH